jgi:hypothetical protein
MTCFTNVSWWVVHGLLNFNLMPRLPMRLCWKSWRTFDCKSIDNIEVTRDVQLIVRAGPSDCLADIWSCSEDEDDRRCAGHDSECREKSGASAAEQEALRLLFWLVDSCVSRPSRNPSVLILVETRIGIRGGENPAGSVYNQH